MTMTVRRRWFTFAFCFCSTIRSTWVRRNILTIWRCLSCSFLSKHSLHSMDVKILWLSQIIAAGATWHDFLLDNCNLCLRSYVNLVGRSFYLINGVHFSCWDVGCNLPIGKFQGFCNVANGFCIRYIVLW